MSAAKKLITVLALAAALAALCSGLASAQGSPSNPSGGTAMRPSREEGTGPVLPTDYLSRGIALDARLMGWVSTTFAFRYSLPVASRPGTGRTAWAITRRNAWGR